MKDYSELANRFSYKSKKWGDVSDEERAKLLLRVIKHVNRKKIRAAYYKKWYAEAKSNPELIESQKASKDKYRKSNPEYVARCLQKGQSKEYVSVKRIYAKKNKKAAAAGNKKWYYSEKAFDGRLKKMYGIGINVYKEMLISQNFSCKICKTLESDLEKRLCVDHCHMSNRVRGLLCSRCNLLIGNSDDSIKLLVDTAVYLSEHMLDADDNRSAIIAVEMAKAVRKKIEYGEKPKEVN